MMLEAEICAAHVMVLSRSRVWRERTARTAPGLGEPPDGATLTQLLCALAQNPCRGRC